jgi:hypothetical protein
VVLWTKKRDGLKGMERERERERGMEGILTSVRSVRGRTENGSHRLALRVGSYTRSTDMGLCATEMNKLAQYFFV